MNQNRTVSLVAVVGAALLSVPLLTAEPIISAGSTTVSTGNVFTLPVSITNASDLFAFQFDLDFDPAVLSLLSISEGGFLPAAGSTFFVSGAIDNVAGTATATADAPAGSIPGASGSGTLADFMFQAMSPGASSLTLSNVILLDSSLNDIPLTTADGSVTVTATSVVPEPPGLSWIGCLGLTGLLLATRRRRPKRT